MAFDASDSSNPSPGRFPRHTAIVPPSAPTAVHGLDRRGDRVDLTDPLRADQAARALAEAV